MAMAEAAHTMMQSNMMEEQFVDEQIPAETQYNVSNETTPTYYYQDANGQYVQYPMQTQTYQYQQPYQYQMNSAYSLKTKFIVFNHDFTVEKFKIILFLFKKSPM